MQTGVSYGRRSGEDPGCCCLRFLLYSCIAITGGICIGGIILLHRSVGEYSDYKSREHDLQRSRQIVARFTLFVASCSVFALIISGIAMYLLFTFSKELRKRCSVRCLTYRERMEDMACSYIWALRTGDLEFVKKVIAVEPNMINKVFQGRCKKRPLIIASKHKHIQIVEYLLNYGARSSYAINNSVPIHRTALQSVCISGRREIIDALIKHSFVGYALRLEADDYAFVELLKRKFYSSAKLLICAGYPLHVMPRSMCAWIQNISDESARCFIIDLAQNPYPLQHLCRLTIRASFGGKCIQRKLDRLSIPNGGSLPYTMVKFLKLELASMKCVFLVDDISKRMSIGRNDCRLLQELRIQMGEDISFEV